MFQRFINVKCVGGGQEEAYLVRAGLPRLPSRGAETPLPAAPPTALPTAAPHTLPTAFPNTLEHAFALCCELRRRLCGGWMLDAPPVITSVTLREHLTETRTMHVSRTLCACGLFYLLAGSSHLKLLSNLPLSLTIFRLLPQHPPLPALLCRLFLCTATPSGSPVLSKPPSVHVSPQYDHIQLICCT